MSLGKSLPAILAGTMMAVFAVAAHATTYTYTYTGNDFTQTVVGSPPILGGSFTPFTTSEKVTGSFSIPFALAASLSSYGVSQPLATYSFSDGINTFASGRSNPSGFLVSTDANGNIDAWRIYLFFGGTVEYQIESDNGLGSPTEDFGEEGNGTLGENFNDPGVWTESIDGVPVTPPPVPEPPTLLLVVSGALGLVGVMRRVPDRCGRLRSWIAF